MVRQCVLGMLLFRDFVQKEKELEINKCYNENCLDTMATLPMFKSKRVRPLIAIVRLQQFYLVQS